MEPVSLIVGIVLGLVLGFVILAVLGYYKKKQMEKQMEAIFGGLDFSQMLDGLGDAIVLPDATPPRPRRPVEDNPQGL